ncbi:MAG TPA: NAD(P)H-dependent oxidoreductase subunit E, partial [Burkholderiales bacterium]|nr:NAD(P)H-dependent oxidoreductase subunit E [Burkholderiales bacterium]
MKSPKGGRARGTLKGRGVDPAARAEVAALLGGDPRRRDLLIEYLHRIQDRYGHLSAARLAALAEALRLSQTEVYEVATFYHHFDVVKEGEAPPPALTVRVCDSLSCELAGSGELLEKLPRILGKDVRILHAPCVGRCESAPVAVVGQNPVCNATVDTVRESVEENRTRCPETKYLDFAAYRKQGGYRLIADCLAGKRSRDEITKVMEDSGLRGLGGAGFPAGRKWRIVAAEPAPRVMAVNIDEGEPGTFKDRWVLERDPHRFLEGMLVAAWCAGVGEIWIYLRDEYAGCRAILERELDKLRRSKRFALPPISLRRGAGAYICGEESAMIESIEGKRGMPRLRPPYVAQVGLFGYPTLEHN